MITSSPIKTWIALAALLVPTAAQAALHIEDIHASRTGFDTRTGSVAPSAAALATVEALGATARWNDFGTVHALFRDDGFLATGLAGDPATAARQWIRAHRELFGLSEAGVEALALERDARFEGSSTRVLLFGQRAGAMPVAPEGRIKVALVDGNLFWVASSAVGEPGEPAAPALDAQQAWIAAAQGLGLDVALEDLSAVRSEGDWQVFDVVGLSHPGRARPVVVGVPGAAAQTAWETIVVDFRDGDLIGFTTFVDGASGERLVGVDRVQQALESDEELPASGEAFAGSYPPNQVGTCGPCHGPFTATAEADWDALEVIAHHLAAGDITFDVFLDDPGCGGAPVAHQDLLTTPERTVVAPVVPGDYYVRVCPFDSTTNLLSGDYAGLAAFRNELSPNTNPKWRYFPAYPSLDFSPTDTRILGCWFDTDAEGGLLAQCERELATGSSHGIPWDFVPQASAASETTTGNNARSSEAWGAFLSAGGPYQPVVDSTDPKRRRVYDFPWTNQWFAESCNPLIIGHSGGLQPDADIDAAIVNLFALHNEMHDFAYHLGLRERQGVAQLSNFGTTGPERQHDPELGNAQAGALTGGWPAYTGRDNANQLTLNDGIAPLSNMYLWQTIGGAIYVPCVDGDFDAGVIAHEYGHLVQNRMVDPENGLSGRQGRAMGESWSDLTAISFLNQYGRVPVADENPFAVGAYITDPQTGIRNYAMNDSPLTFGEIGYDIVCTTDLVTGRCTALTQVHADGEIWSAVNFDLRQALTAKYDSSFPSSDGNLQRRCADGQLPPDQCPGNRRWSQLMHDAMLLMPSAPTMVDARDAYLAADRARAADPVLDWPSNQAELWEGFSRRGFGADAFAADGSDFEPIPSFASPLQDNAQLTFELLPADDPKGAPLAGEIYAGDFEARATPVADTHGDTGLDATQYFVPGTYGFLARADGYGHFRFELTVKAGQRSTVSVSLPRNWASVHAGASAHGAGSDHHELIDDTESTNWERLGAVPSVDEERPAVTVVLPGVQRIDRVQVSGMLEAQLRGFTQNRFSSVHGFRLRACNAAVANCDQASSYTVILDAPDAFPSADLRPLVPDMTLRSFATAPVDATHLEVEVLHNKCSGTPKYQGYLGIPGHDDADPNNGTDCRTGSPPLIGPKNVDVRVAELQAFGGTGTVKVKGASAR